MSSTEVNLMRGDCLELLRGMDDNSIDSIVTDPPYGLSRCRPGDITEALTAWLAGEPYQPKGKGFMGKSWDAFVPGPEVWRECLRVLKPGGHMAVFAGSRTVDLMGVSVRLAGFEVRDQLQWLYGSGFPKSLNVSKAIDKASPPSPAEMEARGGKSIGARWDGWGTALKPAHEPIILARKPLTGTVAANVLEHGTGGINVDGCRVGTSDSLGRTNNGAEQYDPSSFTVAPKERTHFDSSGGLGRWPANVILDEEAGALLDEQSGVSKSTNRARHNKPSENGSMSGANCGHISGGHNDSGGASRFFYCPKTSKREREAGLGIPRIVTKTRTVPMKPPGGVVERKCHQCGDHRFEAWTEADRCEYCDPELWASRLVQEEYQTEEHFDPTRRTDGRSKDIENPRLRTSERCNGHPTVKPLALMSWLCRLITPPGGTVLDPFTGSGSTGCAAAQEGFNFVGCELSEEYVKIAKARIEHWRKDDDTE